ncbi:MAG: GntR family transcriptional regulator [Rhodospirillaceae bacterium]|jgi:DNA-binding GntR family transcriptional regulator|nr:GntR family transcriptional regulator [Rhodospirillaceae bacterium]MBT5664541.1 GntR family transcriptional regulator [Rhodospirillaceae bacterium]MBT5812039.1 GntR family transcriptional regulator [Rhodospirillaceae bacterium]
MQFNISVSAAPLRERVVDVLRQAITECHFEPGGRLVERELCDLMSVSRGSVREALRQLESEGLVTLIPNIGPVVTSLSPDEARTIYEVRAVMEGLAAKLFTMNANEQTMKRLVKTVDRIRETIAAHDEKGMLNAKSRFYDILAEGCGNPVASEQLRLLRARVTLLRGVTLSQRERVAESFMEVEAMLDAIRSRDPDKAWSSAVAHIDKCAEAAIQALHLANASVT